MIRRLVAAASVAVALVSVVGPATAATRVTVFAHIAAPGEPSLTLVTPDKHVFVGTFEDVAGSNTSPSKVFEYDAHGTLLHTFVIKGQTPNAAHGVQVAARDRNGRLYVLDQQPARVIVLDRGPGPSGRTRPSPTYRPARRPTAARAAATRCSTTHRSRTTPRGCPMAACSSPTSPSS